MTRTTDHRDDQPSFFEPLESRVLLSADGLTTPSVEPSKPSAGDSPVLEFTNAEPMTMASGDENAASKKWLASNFRFELGGLPDNHVTKIDELTVKQEVKETAAADRSYAAGRFALFVDGEAMGFLTEGIVAVDDLLNADAPQPVDAASGQFFEALIVESTWPTADAKE